MTTNTATTTAPETNLYVMPAGTLSKELNRALGRALEDAFFYTEDDFFSKNENLIFALNTVFKDFNSLVRMVLAILQEDELWFILPKLKEWTQSRPFSSCEKIIDLCANETWISVRDFLLKVVLPHHHRMGMQIHALPSYRMHLEFLVRSLVPDFADHALKQELWMWFHLKKFDREFPAGLSFYDEEYALHHATSSDLHRRQARRELQEAQNYEAFAAALKNLELAKRPPKNQDSDKEQQENDEDNEQENDDDNEQ